MLSLTILNKVHCEHGYLVLEFLVGTLHTGQWTLDAVSFDAYSEEEWKVWIILVLVNQCNKGCSGLDWLGSVVHQIARHLCGAGVALFPCH